MFPFDVSIRRNRVYQPFKDYTLENQCQRQNVIDAQFFSAYGFSIMTQQPEKNQRVNISLTGDDAILVEKVRDAIEKRLSKRLSLAQVIKIALRQQASAEQI